MLEGLRRTLRLHGRNVPYEQLPPPMRAKLDLLGEIGFCALYDLCCWLGDAVRPVPSNVGPYVHREIAGVASPRERLGCYADPRLVILWNSVIAPFTAAGFVLAPELGDSAVLNTDDATWTEDTCEFEMRFPNLSRVSACGGPARPVPPGYWLMTLRISLATAPGRVDDAYIRPAGPVPSVVRDRTGAVPAGPGPGTQGAGGAPPAGDPGSPAAPIGPAAQIDPFALLAAVPALSMRAPAPVFPSDGGPAPGY